MSNLFTYNLTYEQKNVTNNSFNKNSKIMITIQHSTNYCYKCV